MNTKPTVDEVLNAIEQLLRRKVGGDWEMMNIDADGDGAVLTLSFGGCKEQDDE